MVEAIGGFCEFYSMSPFDVLESPWFLFYTFLEYKNKRIEEQNKQWRQQRNK